jgi:NAD(P)-dependent dehydrogenase (short-subunit alcohol dehydrogenase family)
MTSQCALLQDKVVVLTGATGGFGRRLSRTMADHGARLVLIDLDAEEVARLAAELGSARAASLGLAVDLRDEGAIEAAVDRIRQELGRIDVLVNAAAVLRDAKIENVTREDWVAGTEVNLRGTYVMCQQVGKAMIEQGGGAIITVTSIAAHTAAPNRSVYSMTKAALRSLTEQLAVEWGPYNIRSNSIFFGGIGWTMKGYAPVDPMRIPVESLPLRRMGRDEEFANAVVFLASDLASYVNGAELVVDGGRSLTLLATRPTSAERPPP